MLFVRNLHDIYYDIYQLVKMGFSAEYAESISPGERELYKSYKVMEESERNSEDNVNAAESAGLDINDLY